MRFIDRKGQYEEDVHRELTIVLAYAVGFSDEQARAIGESNQHVDDNPNTNPESISNVQARKDYHFTTQERRDRLWETFSNHVGMGNNPQAYWALGTFFHPQQDSYSHDGFNPYTGQVSSGLRRGIIATSWNAFWAEVRKVDKTNFDPVKAERMAADTFSRLLRARNMMERRGTFGAFRKPISYDLIKDDVARWVRAGDKEKPKILQLIRNKIDMWFINQNAPVPERRKRTKTKVRIVENEE